MLPLLLLLLPGSRRRHWLTLFCGASLLVCLASSFSTDARFYLLATRAWELLIGVIGALLVSGVPGKQGLRDARAIRWAFPVAIVAVSVVPFVQISSPHPGGQALIVCLATLVVILRNHDAEFHPAPIRGLRWVGDMSYSLSGPLAYASTSLAARHLSYTVRELQALGKRVLVVAPPPTAGFNSAACQERRLKGQLILGAPRDCETGGFPRRGRDTAIESGRAPVRQSPL